MPIKAPYNFVPLSKTVVCPEWSHLVSHDVPFRNGISGKIKVTMKAVTPIFVRNGVSQKQSQSNDNKQPQVFNQHNGYFIPATSLKGMIRSVLEIMSFGKMNGRINDDRYSIRDFSNDNLYNPSKISNEVQCGWLYQTDGTYFLKDCGRPGRISHEEIDNKFGNGIKLFFTEKRNLGDKSAKDKYKKYGTVTESMYSFDAFDDSFNRKICTFSDNGTTIGKIVFTGQPSPRNYYTLKGKHLEFVFISSDKKEIEISPDIIKNFFFAYYDHDLNRQTADWKYWKPKLDKGEKIPIFFRRKNGTILDMGLSMLYKITYKVSVVEAVSKHQEKVSGADLADTMFGFTNDKQQLKGRVYFSHAKANNDCNVLPPYSLVLATPKASYYPNYIRQTTPYTTFMDDNPEISGWKRYPARSSVSINAGANEAVTNDKILTKFIPLGAGASFQFDIQYHNLNDIELGALFSALTFHQTDDTHHALGLAKPYGLGVVKLSLDNVDKALLEQSLCAFEGYMNNKLGNLWHKTPQITELVAMAMIYDSIDNTYMSLDEHKKAKENKEFLEKHTKRGNITVQVKSVCKTPTQRNQVIGASSGKDKASIIAELEKKKQDILQELRNKKALIGEQVFSASQTADLDKIKQEIAPGLVLHEDLTKGRDAIDKVTGTTEVYLKKYKQIHGETVFLPESDQEVFINTVKKVYENLKLKEKDKWNLKDEKNPYFKKVSKFIGPEKTKSILP